MTDPTLPPPDLGLSLDEAERAMQFNLRVRYWPLRTVVCQPHVGYVRAVQECSRTGGAHLWVTGKSGFVLGSHCELYEPGEQELALLDEFERRMKAGGG